MVRRFTYFGEMRWETVIWLFREQLAAGESLEECAGLIENMKTADELLCEYGEN